MSDMRTVFAETASALLDEDPLAAVVLAEISVDMFGKAAARHPDRVLNVGIREQLMVSVGGGLALAGMRPIVHTYAPFLVERAYEQVKLDLAHQDAHAVLVSIGASYDAASAGRMTSRTISRTRSRSASEATCAAATTGVTDNVLSATAEPPTNVTSPATYILRRPNRSPRLPEVSSSPANTRL